MKTSNSEKMEKTGSAGRSSRMSAEMKGSSVKGSAAEKSGTETKCKPDEAKPGTKKPGMTAGKKGGSAAIDEPKGSRR